MDGTILSQGNFVAPTTIIPVYIPIPSGADFMHVKNYTQYGNGSVAYAGVDFYWQRGMAPGTGIVQLMNSSSTLLGDTLVSGGFTLYDPTGLTPGSQQPIGAPVAITTGVSNATQPVVTTTNTAGIVAGTIVRIYSGTTAISFDGIDMVVSSVIANTSFTLLTTNNALATAPGAGQTLGTYSIVNSDYLFYPRSRYVTNITAGGQVSTSIPHGFTPGQAIHFNIPSVSGMTQLNPTQANNFAYSTVTSLVDQYTFIIDTLVAGFTPFTSPKSSQEPVQWPTCRPVGENTGFALSSPTIQIPGLGPTATTGVPVYNAQTGILADATVNTGFLGMILGTGGIGTILTGNAISGPAGTAAADVVYWVAGKSSYGGL